MQSAKMLIGRTLAGTSPAAFEGLRQSMRERHDARFGAEASRRGAKATP